MTQNSQVGSAESLIISEGRPSRLQSHPDFQSSERLGKRRPKSIQPNQRARPGQTAEIQREMPTMQQGKGTEKSHAQNERPQCGLAKVRDLAWKEFREADNFPIWTIKPYSGKSNGLAALPTGYSENAATKNTAGSGLCRSCSRSTNQTQPDPLGFCCLVPVATRYKTRCRRLHGGYMRNCRYKLKSPVLSIK